MFSDPGRRRLVLVLVWAGALLAILPLLLHWTAPASSRTAGLIAEGLALVAAALLWRSFYQVEIRRLSRSQTIGLLLVIFVLTAAIEYTHHFFVDLGSMFPGKLNTVWQEEMQGVVTRLDPSALPHSYRFLPNALVLWLQMCRVPFQVASEIYRGLSMLVLFYTLYRWGRLFTSHLGALIATMLAGVIYPVSFVAYAGQLTDPLSHLSFLLAFIFLETEEFAFFLSALLIGSLAKETVLGLLGFYLLFGRKEKGYAWKAPVVLVACLAAYFAVRSYVLHGVMQYNQVSGVNAEFVLTNLRQRTWPPHLLLTGLVFLPFLFLSWKETPLLLKRLTFYLLPLLVVSSTLFSWLNEARNYMPLVFVLAVVAGRYLVAQQDEAAGAAGAYPRG